MSFEPIVVDMEIEEIPEVVDMELAEEINVTVIQGTDVSDTTAIESDVKTGKVFYKASGDRAVGTLSESTEAPLKDVNFIDYDGTILYSYTAAEFAVLTELPPNPAHDGLTAQGWNWTLEDAKEQVSAIGILDIGQMYVTNDGKSRIYITIADDGRMNPTLQFSQTVSEGVSVDWGDGSAIKTVSGTGDKSLNHSYASKGDYVITLEVTSGTAGLGKNTSTGTVLYGNIYRSRIKKIEIGSNITLLGQMYNTYGLETVTIPKTLTAASYYNNCTSLKALVIPAGATEYPGMSDCNALKYVSIPKSCVQFGSSAIYNALALRRISFPKQITSMSASMLYRGLSLTKLVIPASVTSIAEKAIAGNSELGELHFKSEIPPTVANSNAFNSLPAYCKIYVPTGKLSAYTGATNYPDSSTYTYVEE